MTSLVTTLKVSSVRILLLFLNMHVPKNQVFGFKFYVCKFLKPAHCKIIRDNFAFINFEYLITVNIVSTIF